MDAEGGWAVLPGADGAHGYAGQFGGTFDQVNGQYAAVSTDENFQFHRALNLLAQRFDGIGRSWPTFQAAYLKVRASGM